MSYFIRRLVTTLFFLLSLMITFSWSSFADFGFLGSRTHEHTCVDIPKNMSLCIDIGYTKMRLPNLLSHDTLMEANQQSTSWIPLLNINCHPHTKVFLCSLFAPICLENQIFPCRSLCLEVQSSCEEQMLTHGYHWPDMLSCNKFPEDNDMCIKAPSKKITTKNTPQRECSSCSPDISYEDVADKYCQADTVLKAKVKRQRGEILKLGRIKVMKSGHRYRKNRRTDSRFKLTSNESNCCDFSKKKTKYLIFAKKDKKFLKLISLFSWDDFKKRISSENIFRSVNCSENKELNSTTSKTNESNDRISKTGKRKRKKTRKTNSKRQRKNNRSQKKGKRDKEQ